MAGEKLFKIGIEIGGKLGPSLQTSIRAAQGQVSTLAQNMTRTLNRAAGAGKKSFGDMVNTPGWQAAAVGAAGIGIALRSALQISMQFEKSASSLQAKLQATPQQMIPLLDQAKLLGASTKFTASQAVEAMDFLAMAGYKTNQILEVTPGVLKLAAVANMELAQAADIASNILGGMRLPISKTANLIDLLAKTSVSGNLDLRMLGESFKYVGPVAAQAGISMEKMAASMAILGDSGIQASEAGTGLRGVILRLAAPTKETAGALKTLGVATADAKGDLKDFPVLMAELGTALSKVEGSANRAALLEGLFGKLQAAAGGVLLEAGRTGALAERVLTVSDNAGAAGKMAEQMQNNLAGAVTRLGSAWEGLQLAMADPKGTGGLKDLVDGLATFVGTAAKFANENPKLTSGLVATAAALSALVLAAPFIAATISVISTLGAGLAAFGSLGLGATIAGWLGVVGPLLAALTGPIGLAALAVIGLGMAFVAAYKHVDWFRARVDGWMTGFRMAWGGLLQFAGGAWTMFTSALSGDWVGFGEGWQRATAGLRKIWEGWCHSAASVFGVSVERLKGFFNIFVGLFTGDTQKMRSGWDAATRGMGAAFSRTMDGLGPALSSAVSKLGDVASREFEKLGQNAGEKFAKALRLALAAINPASMVPNLIMGAAPPPAEVARRLAGNRSRPAPPAAGRNAAPGRQRAMGGPVFKGLDYLVGEKRPEVFRAPVSGRIFPSVEAAERATPAAQGINKIVPFKGGKGGERLQGKPPRAQSAGGAIDALSQGLRGLLRLLGVTSKQPEVFRAPFKGIDQIVGEKQPEVFRAPVSGRIFPSVKAAERATPSTQVINNVAPFRGGKDSKAGEKMQGRRPRVQSAREGINALSHKLRGLLRLLGVESRRPGRALGGQVFKGVEYNVGERQSEVFRPQASTGRRPLGDIGGKRGMPAGAGPAAGNAGERRAPLSDLGIGRGLMAGPGLAVATVGGVEAAPPATVAPSGRQGLSGPLMVLQPGAIQVTVGSGDPGTVERAVASALDQFRYELESSYRSLLND